MIQEFYKPLFYYVLYKYLYNKWNLRIHIKQSVIIYFTNAYLVMKILIKKKEKLNFQFLTSLLKIPYGKYTK